MFGHVTLDVAGDAAAYWDACIASPGITCEFATTAWSDIIPNTAFSTALSPYGGVVRDEDGDVLAYVAFNHPLHGPFVDRFIVQPMAQGGFGPLWSLIASGYGLIAGDPVDAEHRVFGEIDQAMLRTIDRSEEAVRLATRVAEQVGTVRTTYGKAGPGHAKIEVRHGKWPWSKRSLMWFGPCLDDEKRPQRYVLCNKGMLDKLMSEPLVEKNFVRVPVFRL